jgi:ABC-type sulfate/molybdate transport systems ATPase subunit
MSDIYFKIQLFFPHLDVASNIGYGLRVRGERSNRIKNKVDELMDLMNISHLRETG